ncbi:hypothetical protein F5884DRAFT_764638 [Xylogone sp. PMI_703]|nr:hypothetical protein F5884DRAFT_764638 [Xylogone sp. PMI_703]
MPTTFTTKRPHRKSRAGCIGCKARKIKCDEKRPKCTFCSLRNLECVYKTTEPISPSSSTSDTRTLVRRERQIPRHQQSNWSSIPTPSCSPPPFLMPSLNPTSITLTKSDMRLFHHYTTNTYRSLAYGTEDTRKVLQITIPELAFKSEHDYLMIGILTIASMHLAHLNRDANDVCRQSDIYQMKSISAFRAVLSNEEIISREPEAVVAMAVLLLIIGRTTEMPEDELFVVTWLGLFHGLGDLVVSKIPGGVSWRSIAPIFRRTLNDVKSDPMVPTELIGMLGSITPQDPDFAALEDYCKTLDSFGALYASLKDDGISDALSIRIITWPSYVPKTIANLAKERRPRALIIMAYYIIFTKLVSTIWWWHGTIANREIDLIYRFIEPNHKFRSLLQIPLAARGMDDPQDVRNLLLGNSLSLAATPDSSNSDMTVSC